MKNLVRNTILIAVLLFTSFTSFAQSERIGWHPGVKLSWDDFQGVPNQALTFSAYTAYWISYTYKWNDAQDITVKVNCSFERNKSWKKSNRKLSPELLAHEQAHFDVAEIHARKMRQAFVNYCHSHKKTGSTNADLEAIMKKYLDEANVFNDTYDLETNHGLIETKQKEWERKIANMMSALSPYADF